MMTEVSFLPLLSLIFTIQANFSELGRKEWILFLSAAATKSLQSCPTLCDPINGSPPGSPIPGILQARTLEWAAISFINLFRPESNKCSPGVFEMSKGNTGIFSTSF